MSAPLSDPSVNNPMNADAMNATQAAIHTYYNGERSEMWLILGGFSIIALLCLWLLIAKRDAFSIAFVSVVLAFGLLFSGIGVSLLVRDTSARAELTAAAIDPATPLLRTERARVEQVLVNYRYYRYGMAALLLVAAAAFLFGTRGWLHGLAAGLVCVVFAQALIDHYSEQRAATYHRELMRE